MVHENWWVYYKYGRFILVHNAILKSYFAAHHLHFHKPVRKWQCLEYLNKVKQFEIVFAAFGRKYLDTPYPKVSDTATILSEMLHS